MDTKLNRKIARSVGLLRRHEPDVRISDTPSKVLYVANGGVVCGVQWHELESTFASFGQIVSIHVPKNPKPYVFVVYEHVDSSIKAVDALQGARPTTIAKDVVLYLTYLEQLPNSICHATSSTVVLPPGLHFMPEFITETEEKMLWTFVQSLPRFAHNENSAEGNLLRNRRVYHFGYEFNYDSSSVPLDGPFPPEIPECCRSILDRIVHTGWVKVQPDQLTVNIYQPGQGIPSHVDTHSAFEDAIVSLSLLSDVVMEFRHPTTSELRGVCLPARSLVVMTEEARYVWKHGIAARKHDVLPMDGRLHERSLRCSFTFRAVRRSPCCCAYPRHCDHARLNVPSSSRSLPQDENEGRQLERTFVTDVYDCIANHFDATRHSQWRTVSAFLDSLPVGSLLLDVGCGNGKYLMADDRMLVKIGCDMCESLCSIAASKGCSVLVGDGLHLPFDDDRFDAVISVAVVHHMATEKRRRYAIEQLMDKLRVGGRAFVTVWAYEQQRNGKCSEYIKWGSGKTNVDVDSAHNDRDCDHSNGVSPLPVHQNLHPFRSQDLLVPWKLPQNAKSEQPDDSADCFLRFYHVFKEGELASLCSNVSNCTVLEVIYEQGNWCAILERC